MIPPPKTGKNVTDCGRHEPSKVSSVAPSQTPPGRRVPLLPIISTLAVLLVVIIAGTLVALLIHYSRKHCKGEVSHHSYTTFTLYCISAIEEYSPRRESIKDMMRYFNKHYAFTGVAGMGCIHLVIAWLTLFSLQTTSHLCIIYLPTPPLWNIFSFLCKINITFVCVCGCIFSELYSAMAPHLMPTI